MAKLLLLFIFTLSLLAGCQDTLTEDEVYKDHEQPMVEFTEVFTLGLYEGTEFEQERTFTLDNKNSFTKNIVLGNRTESDETFMLLVFDHGKQLEFKTDSKEQKKKHPFKVESGEYENIEITIDNLNKGFHSITYLVFPNPSKTPTDPEMAMNLTDLYSIRINLLQGIEEIPVTRPDLVNSFTKSTNRKIHGLLVSDEPGTYQIAYNEKVTDDFSYAVRYGNSNSKPLDFYMVALLDYEQVPLGDNQFLYDRLNPEEERQVKFTLNSKSLADNNTFQLMMITSPFDSVTEDAPFLLQDSLLSNKIELIKE